MTDWNKNWKRSKDAGKQRKYRYNAPLHQRQKMVRVHLSPELRKKYGKRTMSVRKEDKVKIVRGQFRGKTGKVLNVNLKKAKVHIENIDNVRKEGTKAPYPLEPSNLMITELFIEDRKRRKLLEGKPKEKKEEKKAVEKKAEKPKEAAKKETKMEKKE